MGEKNKNVRDVYVRLSYTRIFQIDTKNQRFEAEAIIESKWHDKDINSLEHSHSEINWKPGFYIDNCINESRQQISYNIVQEDDKLMVVEIKKIRGLFYENLELESFPLDIQNLTLQITTQYSQNDLNLILMQPELTQYSISNTLDKSMWYLHNAVKVCNINIAREYSFGKTEYPCVEITCQAFRHSGYFHWNALLPIFLITCCSLTPFVLDYSATASRLGTTASMLLTSTSYKIAVSRLLPTVSYLTSLDKYCIGSLVLIAAQLIYHALFGLLHGIFDQYFLGYLDRLFLMVFVTLNIFGQLYYVKWLIKIDDFREGLIKNSIFYENTNNANKKEN